ncbi:MAG: hypothetical protein A2X08_09955 [Bacteroidetes bacterium GWA2_32_17]|nr:MAG: hypothetical protein A2X08_09955 [Bacteroidetes bacterium GWA2_32_17]
MKPLILILFTIFYLSSQAQLFLEISNGYAIPIKKSTLPTPWQNLTTYNYYKQSNSGVELIENDTSYNDIKKSFGVGYNVSGGLTYFFNKYLGLNLGYTYSNDSLTFSKNKYQKSFTFITEYLSHNISSNITEIDYSINSINHKLFAGITLQLPVNKFVPYVKGGITVNNRTLLIKSTYIYDSYNGYHPYAYPRVNNYIVEEYTNPWKLSYSASIGSKYNFKNFAVFFETSFIFDKFKPSKGKIKEVYLEDHTLDSKVPKVGDNITFLDKSEANSQTLGYEIDPWLNTSPGYNNTYSTNRINNSYNFSLVNFSIGIQYKIPSNKTEFLKLNESFISHLFFEISNGYAFSLQKKKLPIPYFNGSENAYLTKEPLYDSINHYYRYFTDHTTIKNNPAKMNFGTGYNINGSIGYYIGKYLGLSITYNYNNSQDDFNNKRAYNYAAGNDYYGNIQGKSEFIFTFYSINKSYILNSILQYPISKHITPFIKLGLSRSTHVIYVNNTNINTDIWSAGSDEFGSKEKYYGSYSLGYVLSFGTKYNIKNFSFLFECRFVFDKYSPPKLYSYNYYCKYSTGTYGSVPPDHKTELEDYNGFDNTIQNSMPETRYKNTFAFSTISLNLGVQYTLSFKK